MLYRKSLAIFVALLTLLSMTSVAFADTNISDEHSTLKENKFILENSSVVQKEVDKIIENDIKNNNTIKGPRYKYMTKYLPYQYKTVGAYAGNQPPQGVRFANGGGFYYSMANGPSISFSITVSLPPPFNVVSFSANFGTVNNSGEIFDVPDTTHYFKLYIQKNYEIRPYVIYRARVGTNNWKIYTSGAVPIYLSHTGIPVIVG